MLQNLRNTKKLALISADPAGAFECFRHAFPCIDAGGGLVTEPEGRVLMIFRNGRWDLPKGKREEGENFSACAVREVGEECGIPLPVIEGGLTDTFHFYLLEDTWVLKRTVWFRMSSRVAAPPVPQTEEGIGRAEWVPPHLLGIYLQGTYPAVIDVFEAAGYAVGQG
ncbi:MAG: NUDIX domain-containing protein [Rikenellaceae bacterium]|nr:NUDIX domain-containing protein [Rikenellaceae bacterium]